MAAIRGGLRGPGRCAGWRRTGRDETAPRPYTPCQWFTTIVTARLSDISWRSSRSVGAPRRYAHPLGGIGRISLRCTARRRDDGHETRPMAALRGRPRGPGQCARCRRTGRDETAPRPYKPCQWFTTIVTARLSDISWRSSRSVGAPRRCAHPLGGIGRISLRCTARRRDDGHETRPMAALRGRPRGPGQCARCRRTGRDETAPRPYKPCQWFTTIVTARLSDISWRSSRSVGAPRRCAHPLGGIARGPGQCARWRGTRATARTGN